MVNQINNQGQRPHCTMFAVCAAIESETGQKFTDQEIFDLYDKATGGTDGTLTIVCANYMKELGYIKDVKRIHSNPQARWCRRGETPHLNQEVFLTLQGKKKQKLIFGIAYNTPRLPIDDNFVWNQPPVDIVNDKAETRLHAVHPVMAWGAPAFSPTGIPTGQKRLGAVIENSWSDAWGDKGFFYMSTDYMLKSIQEILLLTF